jgi:hypothetical protein
VGVSKVTEGGCAAVQEFPSQGRDEDVSRGVEFHFVKVVLSEGRDELVSRVVILTL